MKKPVLTEPYYKALIYGQPGSGKTWLAASAQEVLGNCLMVSCSGNPISLRKFGAPLPDIVEISQLGDFNAVYDFLSKKQPAKHEFLEDAAKAGIELHPPYQTIIVDSITEVQRQVFHVVSPGLAGPPGNVAPTLEIRDFNKILGTMLNWAFKFVRLDMHVILTSLEAEKQSGTAGAIYCRPLIWGQSEGEISGYVYQVVRMQPIDQADAVLLRNDPLAGSKDARVVAYFRANSRYYAKDQYNTGRAYLINPTMAQVWADIMKEM